MDSHGKGTVINPIVNVNPYFLWIRKWKGLLDVERIRFGDTEVEIHCLSIWEGYLKSNFNFRSVGENSFSIGRMDGLPFPCETELKLTGKMLDSGA